VIDWQAIGVVSTVIIGVGGGAVVLIWRAGGWERSRKNHNGAIKRLHARDDRIEDKVDGSMKAFREECLNHRRYQEERHDEIIGAIRERLQEGEAQFGRLEQGMVDTQNRLGRIETAVNNK